MFFSVQIQAFGFLLGFFLEPALSAHSDVAIVSAETNLFAFENYVAMIVHTRVDGGFCTAFTHGLYLAYGFRNLE